jgi:hypothetical protein
MGTRLAFLLAAAIVTGGVASLAAEARRMAPYDRALEDSLFYRIPDGFQAKWQPAGILIYPAATPPGSAPEVLVLSREIVVDPPLRRPEARSRRGDLARSIAQALAASLTDEAEPVVREQPAPAPPRGARVEIRSFSIEARRGKPSVTLRAIALFDGIAFHLLIAIRPATAPPVPGALETLYASLGFARLGDSPPDRPASPLPDQPSPSRADRPAGPGAANAQPRRRESGPQCRIVQRQQCSGGIGTSLGYFCTTVPRRICD